MLLLHGRPPATSLSELVHGIKCCTSGFAPAQCEFTPDVLMVRRMSAAQPPLQPPRDRHATATRPPRSRRVATVCPPRGPTRPPRVRVVRRARRRRSCSSISARRPSSPASRTGCSPNAPKHASPSAPPSCCLPPYSPSAAPSRCRTRGPLHPRGCSRGRAPSPSCSHSPSPPSTRRRCTSDTSFRAA